MDETKRSTRFQRGLFEWVEEFVFALIAVSILLSFVARVVAVNGISMLPNYVENDMVVVSNLAGEIETGDVVVMIDVLDTPIIKRVIATQGQRVDIDDIAGVVSVDGIPIDEAIYGLENGITTKVYTTLTGTPLPQTVPDGCVFVLGDNRSVSEDSRFSKVGMVDKRKIIGKAIFRLFPFQKFGFLPH